MSRRRIVALALGAIALVLVLLGVGLLWQQFAVPTQKANEVPPVKVTHLSAQDISHLEKALNSPDMHVQATVMVPELASAYLAKGQPAYPVGSTVKVLQSTSVCKGRICQVKSAVMEPGGKQLTFLLYLTNASGKWLVFSTNIGTR